MHGWPPADRLVSEHNSMSKLTASMAQWYYAARGGITNSILPHVLRHPPQVRVLCTCHSTSQSLWLRRVIITRERRAIITFGLSPYLVFVSLPAVVFRSFA